MTPVSKLRLECKNFINKLNRANKTNYFIFSVYNGGVFDEGSQSYRKFTGERGISDLVLVANGITHYVELKYGKDTMSKSQREFRAKVVEAEALYVIVKTLDDFQTFVLDRVLCIYNDKEEINRIKSL